MKRRDFITTAAVLTAASYSNATLRNIKKEGKNTLTNITGPLNRSFGFFDVDCLELAQGDKWKSVFPLFSLRERAVPLTQSLNTIHKIAQDNDHPFAFTTCCSGRLSKQADIPDIVYVSMDESDTAWKEKLDTHRMFYLEKSRENKSCYEMFEYNSNASFFFKEINVDRWVLFGNGAETCVSKDALKLIDIGCKIIVLTDVLQYAAKGYGHSGLSGTPAGRAEMLAEIKYLGGELMSLGEFLQEYNYTITGAKWDPDLQKTVYKKQ